MSRAPPCSQLWSSNWVEVWHKIQENSQETFIIVIQVIEFPESWEQSSFRFEIKLDFIIKKLKKNRFCDFRFQKIIILCRFRLNFWKTCQDSKKMTYLLVGMFMDKIKNFCDHSMILWEMVGDLPSNGLNQPPPLCFLGLMCIIANQQLA